MVVVRNWVVRRHKDWLRRASTRAGDRLQDTLIVCLLVVSSTAAVTVELLGHKVVQLLRGPVLVVARCLPIIMAHLLLQCRDESWVEHLLVVVL